MKAPVCVRCGSKMKILFRIEWFCPNDCDKIPPGPPCPKCGSTVTELQVIVKMDCREQSMHCWPCGAVWDEQEISWSDEA